MGAKSKSPHFAPRLREAMAAKGYTQEALAREIDVSLSAVTAWIYKESEPRARQLLLLSDVLEREPSWFFSEPEKEAA